MENVAVMVFAYNTIFIIPYSMRVYRSCVELCADWLLPSSVAIVERLVAKLFRLS